jgi:hypothetical protein
MDSDALESIKATQLLPYVELDRGRNLADRDRLHASRPQLGPLVERVRAAFDPNSSQLVERVDIFVLLLLAGVESGQLRATEGVAEQRAGDVMLRSKGPCAAHLKGGP